MGVDEVEIVAIPGTNGYRFIAIAPDRAGKRLEIELEPHELLRYDVFQARILACTGQVYTNAWCESRTPCEADGFWRTFLQRWISNPAAPAKAAQAMN